MRLPNDPPYIMEDVGRRVDHLMDLHKLWGDALQIISSRTWQSPLEKRMVERLTVAKELLEEYLENSCRTKEPGPTEL